VNHFVDMHDLGGALQRAGFAEPVLDVDRHVLCYPDAMALMRELKEIGAHNVNAGRARALTGRHRFARMVEAYQTRRTPAGLPATYEVVHAVAWRPAAAEPRIAVAPESRISVAALTASLRRRRP
jgi:malonyl-CoA O-methyltransferase